MIVRFLVRSSRFGVARPPARRSFRSAVTAAAVMLLLPSALEGGEKDGKAIDEPLRDRLRQSVEWLASPDREGRGPGTRGIEQAGEWVSRQLAAIGLDTLSLIHI